jgi:hypothetical protein
MARSIILGRTCFKGTSSFPQQNYPAPKLIVPVWANGLASPLKMFLGVLLMIHKSHNL